MSKRLSGKQSNTLFNYFQSPKNVKPKVQQINETAVDETPPKKTALVHTSRESLVEDKFTLRINSSDEEEPILIKSRKKKRIRAVIDSSDDSDSENTESLKKPKRENVQKKSRFKETFAFDVNRSSETSKRDDPPTRISIQTNKTEEVNSKGTRWLHETLDFLQPEKIEDAERRKSNHPDYDPRTLYVPPDFLAKQTPGMRQWWTLKRKYADSILFFKMGKFYELYHMDASIGVRHLGFSYMKGDFAHSGFPETAYNKMVSILINLGFKVARIEQTETPDMLAERSKTQHGKKDKVVRREICQVSSKATCVYGQQMTTPLSAGANYIMAVAEKRTSASKSRYGVVFVDTSIGIFHVGDFDDDKQSSRLLALLAQYPPVMILTERGRITPQTLDMLQKNTARIKFESLAPETQFYSAEKTIKLLQEADYFKRSTDDQLIWPILFNEEFLDHGSPNMKYVVALKCLGALLWYLRDCLIDMQVFSMSQFKLYVPLDILTPSKDLKRDSMILDAIAISNLNLIGGSGTLQRTLDHCRTTFGKRLLSLWICRPLADTQKIKYRQEAIKELISNPYVLKDARQLLSKIPDLERQIMKINTFGNKYYSKTHPDSRAVFYELKTYTKRKIVDLLTTLKGFKDAMCVIDMFKKFESRFIIKLTQVEPKGSFVDVSNILEHFDKLFDAEEALAKGQIFPKFGLDNKYDATLDSITNIQNKLDDYLKKQRKLFGNNVVYFGRDKNRYQLEIPEKTCKNISYDYQLEGARKGCKPSKRYSTIETRDLLEQMMKAEHERDVVIADLNRRIFEQFSSYFPQWERVTQSLTVLDVLCSLANYVASSSQEMCLPTVLPFAENPSIEIEGGCHPCVQIDNYVINSTKFGVGDHSNVLLLTGPNMGGKSTLMRQVALIVIMAQIGLYVPATSCILTAVDRVFTRVGARDDIVHGESTFLTEMLESSCILRHATSHSMLLVDELGRGTTTHDGTAIAAAYVHAVRAIGARTIFSTHYHSLVEHYEGMDGVQIGHMACFVEEERDKETVTFLYKLTRGPCPKSYGFNVASLAGLPQEIVTAGREKALEMENASKCRSFITKLRAMKTLNVKKDLLLALQRLKMN